MAGSAPLIPEFWAGRRVLLTGHTGFKGAWTSVLLADIGARVTGVALEPEPGPNLWRLFDDRLGIESIICDIRDASALAAICRRTRPQIVLHMAAQAQVRQGYRAPLETYATNVMGTVHLLEAVRSLDGVEVVLAVTSDKVYGNKGDGAAFDEDSPLGGGDPYSASKAAAEFAVRSYADSFFAPRRVPLATARAGNVLGGGDFGSDRLVPDVYRAACRREPVVLRHPQARRPWQHVLDCVCGYLRYVEYLHGKPLADPPALNFGPPQSADGDHDMNVAEVAEAIGRRLGNDRPWQQAKPEVAEVQVLRLDCEAAPRTLGFRPRLGIAETIARTADWYADFMRGSDALALVRAQIKQYAEDA